MFNVYIDFFKPFRLVKYGYRNSRIYNGSILFLLTARKWGYNNEELHCYYTQKGAGLNM